MATEIAKLDKWMEHHRAEIETVRTGVATEIAKLDKWTEHHRVEIQSVLTGVATEFAKLAKSVQESFDARLKVYPNLAQEILPLARRGWFVSQFFGLGDIDELAQCAGTVSADVLDGRIAELYRADLSNQVESILSEFPERAFIFRPAIAAHLRQEYAISIPIFFILTDGICFERRKKYLFVGKEDEHVSTLAKDELEALKRADDENLIMEFFTLTSTIMWSAISERLPIAYNEKNREKYKYFGLNRPMILHGIADESYATEENSLKAFSLLSFMASLMSKPLS